MKEIKTEREENPWKAPYNYEALKELTDVKLSDNPPAPESLLQMATGKEDKEGNPYYNKCFTVGEISVIVGRSGNGKSNLVALLISQMINNNRRERFLSELPNDGKILVMDTEQSEHDVWRLTEKISLINKDNPNTLDKVIVKRTEPLNPAFRKQLLMDLMRDEKPALVVLDGIADILATINDEKEAKETIAEIRSLAQELKIHLVGILHSSDKNTGSNEAMGWAGTVWKHKAQFQMNVHYSKDYEEFTVQFYKARHGFPQDWKFKFDGVKGIPYIPKDDEITKPPSVLNKEFEVKYMKDPETTYQFWVEVYRAFDIGDTNGMAHSKTNLQPVIQAVWCAMAQVPESCTIGKAKIREILFETAIIRQILINEGTEQKPDFKLNNPNTIDNYEM